MIVNGWVCGYSFVTQVFWNAAPTSHLVRSLWLQSNDLHTKLSTHLYLGTRQRWSSQVCPPIRPLLPSPLCRPNLILRQPLQDTKVEHCNRARNIRSRGHQGELNDWATAESIWEKHRGGETGRNTASEVWSPCFLTIKAIFARKPLSVNKYKCCTNCTF